MVEWFYAHWELLAMIGVQLLAVAALVAKLTPSTTDDEWIAKIEAVVHSVVNKPKP